jgi:hypothetical protein
MSPMGFMLYLLSGMVRSRRRTPSAELFMDGGGPASSERAASQGTLHPISSCSALTRKRSERTRSVL